MMSERRIRILMVGYLPLHLGQVKGGVVSVIINLLSGFSKLEGIEIIHVSFNEEILVPVTKQYAPNVKIYYLPYRVKIKLVDYFLNKKLFRDILQAEKPDLIHIQEITPHLLRFLFLPKNRIVVTQHGVMREEMKSAIGLQNKLKYLFKAYVEKCIFPFFKNEIFISEYNKRLFHPKKFLHPKKHFSQNIFNPVNPMFFDTPYSKGISDSLIYVGVINKRKNLEIILKALGILKKQQIIFTLHVVGGYKETWYEEKIVSVIKENAIKDQVLFHGWQTQEQVHKLYDLSAIFILPSQQETMPVSIGEAMAQGKVVVASDVGAISEMFTDKHAGFLFEKNNLNQLCDVLKTLYRNDALIESVSVNARKEAIENFHADLIAVKTLNFYREVIHNSSLN